MYQVEAQGRRRRLLHRRQVVLGRQQLMLWLRRWRHSSLKMRGGLSRLTDETAQEQLRIGCGGVVGEERLDSR